MCNPNLPDANIEALYSHRATSPCPSFHDKTMIAPEIDKAVLGITLTSMVVLTVDSAFIILPHKAVTVLPTTMKCGILYTST
ncbi:hypothetical protein KIN20_034098 [Parelaphostrongylus tenuis]|uniref:Uncharacterized protein n=1 Tax=Parelaphostrongylus tenuis TaxID=148309 RepID=A0AAD5R951_PARTN|nr:hypothetical protein KIN20_034098 [Parelaphostrongylus tenuis]